ncbi:MAG: hypothetical protein NDI61_04250 [Bdellovibrionaceae bacterium]|nr:hypothetical protein [Pseudobdellovibrionaceae bacterium]
MSPELLQPVRPELLRRQQVLLLPELLRRQQVLLRHQPELLQQVLLRELQPELFLPELVRLQSSSTASNR